MSTQPEALWLADELRAAPERSRTSFEAATELRRLHEENERLKAQQTVAWPTMPPSKGQSPVLFEDGYAEGWAKCLSMCKEAVVTSPQPAQQKIGVCGEKRGACGLPCEPCEGKTDPDYVQQPAQQHPDLSHLRPETQEAIRGWIKDGTFFDRAIGAMHDQEKRLMAYEKAQQQEPVAWMFEGIKFDGSKHGPHLVWKPEYMDAMSADMSAAAVPLYTSPPASKPWVGLTDEDIGAACGFAEHTTASTRFALKAISRAIEAKLKEKNT